MDKRLFPIRLVFQYPTDLNHWRREPLRGDEPSLPQSWTSRIQRLGVVVVLAMLAGLVGCGTTTNRLVTEQLLMSDAVDKAIATVDFSSLEGQKVFLDTLYLHSVKGVGFVNSEYIISSLRQQLTASRCFGQDTRETADVIIEPRVGALGTQGHEVVYGIPQTSALNTAAAVFSSSAIPAIPEISVGKSNAQSGIAKIIVYAYDRESREPIWQSGIAKAESTSRDTWFMGAGPFQKGSIYDGIRFAGEEIPEHLRPIPARRATHFQRAGEESLPNNNSPDIESPIEEQLTDDPSHIQFNQKYSFVREEHGPSSIEIAAPPNPDQALAEKASAKKATGEADLEKVKKDSAVQQASFEEPAKAK